MLKKKGLPFFHAIAHRVDNMMLKTMKERAENHKRGNLQRTTKEES